MDKTTIDRIVERLHSTGQFEDTIPDAAFGFVPKDSSLSRIKIVSTELIGDIRAFTKGYEERLAIMLIDKPVCCADVIDFIANASQYGIHTALLIDETSPYFMRDKIKSKNNSSSLADSKTILLAYLKSLDILEERYYRMTNKEIIEELKEREHPLRKIIERKLLALRTLRNIEVLAAQIGSMLGVDYFKSKTQNNGQTEQQDIVMTKYQLAKVLRLNNGRVRDAHHIFTLQDIINIDSSQFFSFWPYKLRVRECLKKTIQKHAIRQLSDGRYKSYDTRKLPKELLLATLIKTPIPYGKDDPSNIALDYGLGLLATMSLLGFNISDKIKLIERKADTGYLEMAYHQRIIEYLKRKATEKTIVAASETEPGKLHTITIDSKGEPNCSCEIMKYKGGVCKHIRGINGWFEGIL